MMTMACVAIVFRRPAGAVRLSVAPQLASWDKAGTPGQVRLAGFLAHVDALAGPVMAATTGRVAVKLTVGLPDEVPLIDGGRDLDNYLLPIAQRLGPQRVAAMFSRNPWNLMARCGPGPGRNDRGNAAVLYPDDRLLCVPGMEAGPS